jgi:hypothetical protein
MSVAVAQIPDSAAARSPARFAAANTAHRFDDFGAWVMSYGHENSEAAGA